MRRRGFLVGAGAVLAAPGLLRAAPAVVDLAGGFLAAEGLPGVSWAYRAADGRMETGAAGLAVPDSGEAMTPDHRLRLASISKTLTAAMVMTLAEDAGIDLSAPVFAPGGALEMWRPENPPMPDLLDRVTADHLLTHTAGGWGNALFDPVFMWHELNRAELIHRVLRERPLQMAAGTVWAYSNFGYMLLGRLIETVTSQPYDVAIRDRLLVPAGVDSFALGFDRPSERLAGEVAYVSDEMDPYGFPLTRMDAGGGWVARPADLLTLWSQFDGFGAEGVPAGVADGMARPWRPGAFYGRGLVLNPAHGNRWHDGSLPGTTSFAVMVEGGELIACVANGRRETTLAAMEQLLWGLYGLLRKT